MLKELSLDDWLTFIGHQHDQTIAMGLERMHTMLGRLGLERPAPSIVTVAGTNGKGSTCIAIEQLLLAHGLRVGTTMSPHVIRFNERVRINGQESADADLVKAFSRVEAARDNLPLTYFEFSALAAMWCFRHSEVQVAVLEIGLGGRLDAFNAVAADVAVITSIGLDHQEYLGVTVELIGREKAGILRRDQSVVLGRSLPGSVYDVCEELALAPQVCGKEFDYEMSDDHRQWLFTDAEGEMQFPLGSLAPHNVALALTAIRPLVQRDPAICAAASAANLPGRLQEVTIDERRYVFDVCHNPSGAQFCCGQMTDRGLEPKMILCGMLRGKMHQEVRRAVGQAFSATWVLFGTVGDRALSSNELATSMGIASHGCTDFQAAREYVRSVTSPGEVILVFGSFNAVEQGIMSAPQQFAMC